MSSSLPQLMNVPILLCLTNDGDDADNDEGDDKSGKEMMAVLLMVMLVMIFIISIMCVIPGIFQPSYQVDPYL